MNLQIQRNLIVRLACAMLIVHCLMASVVLGASGTVAIVVNTNLYSLIETNLNVYISDITADGYTPVLRQWDPSASDQNTAEELRDYIKTLSNIEGAVFVGTLPIKWYNSTNDWFDESVTFPFDLFFMDLAIEWEDTDADGYIEGPEININPTIWVSRIKCGGMSVFAGQSEPDLVNRYFEKVHRFRTGELRLPDRGILWADSDWDEWTPNFYHCMMSSAYTNTLRITEQVAGVTTDLNDWMNRLQEGYEFEWFNCHSTDTRHIPGGSIYSQGIADAEIKRLFWNCWNCSGAKYSTVNYIAGVRLFAPKYGLIAVGTTKTGSMLNGEPFFSPLNNGDCFGKAFVDWFKVNASDVLWHRGMTLLGDGTLRLGRFTHTLNPSDQPPVISNIPDLVADEDIRSDPLSFTVSDDFTSTSNLTLWAESSDQAIMPSYFVEFGGSGSSRNLTVLSASNQSGSVTVKITVCDGEFTSSTNLLVTFNPVNDNPTATLVNPINGAFLAEGTSFEVYAIGEDIDGMVTQMVFYADGSNELGSVAASSGSVVWSNATLGAHSLNVECMDNGGAVATSLVVNITVAVDSDGDAEPDLIDLDDDNDLMPDVWELSYNLDPLNGDDKNQDIDLDGFLNWEEYVAQTDPTNKTSFFTVMVVSNQSPIAICFQGATGRLYNVECRDNLIDTNSWYSLTNDMLGVEGVMTFEDVAPADSRFYRIKVRLLTP